VFVQMVFLNLFVAIILQGYDESIQRDNRVLNSEMAMKFQSEWSEHDPTATGLLPPLLLPTLLLSLGEPLGWPSPLRGKPVKQRKLVAQLNLTVDKGMLRYKDVLEALTMARMVAQEYEEQQLGRQMLGLG